MGIKSLELNYSAALRRLFLVWMLPVIFTIVSSNTILIHNVTLIIGIISTFMILRKPQYILLGLPFFALLSPIGGMFELFNVRVVLTDWLIFFLIFHMGYIVLQKGKISSFRFSKNSVLVYLLPFLIIYLISFIIGYLYGYIISFNPLYYLLCYIVIYFYFTKYSYREIDWLAIYDAWLYASILGSIVLINSLITGSHLLNFNTMEPDILVNKNSINYLFRASYYYAGFHIVSAVLFIGVLLRLIFANNKFVDYLIGLVSLLILFAALVIMLNKTAIIAVGISSIFSCVILSVYYQRLRIGMIFLVIGMIPLMLMVLLPSELRVESLTSFSSLEARIQVWIGALRQISIDPHIILIGAGPDFVETGNQAISQIFRTAVDSESIEGGLDSTWLTLFVEFGILGVVIIIGLFFASFKILFRSMRQLAKSKIHSHLFLSIFGGIMVLTLVFFTQSIGYAKISWLPFQMILIIFSFAQIDKKKHIKL
jgi:hypothetical protein